ncbi:MAG: hypothetical protein LBT50_01605 [Prevotellaceae bacterium]|jgi:hypothetical protein|nr:hypothetical protein [Prevotellaceae bacterium]
MLNNELKKHPFATPNQYFDELPSKIQDRCVAASKNPGHGFIPKIAWAGGIVVLILSLFLSYFSDSFFTKQNPDIQTAGVESVNIVKPASGMPKNFLKSKRDAAVDYFSARRVSVNDYLASKY